MVHILEGPANHKALAPPRNSLSRGHLWLIFGFEDSALEDHQRGFVHSRGTGEKLRVFVVETVFAL